MYHHHQMTRYSEDVTLIPAARWTLLSAPVSHVSSRPGSLLCPPLCPSLCWSNPTFSFRKLFSSMTSLFHPTALYNRPKHFSCRDLFYCQAMSSARIYFFFHTTDCLHDIMSFLLTSQIITIHQLPPEPTKWTFDRTKERLSTVQSQNSMLCATFLQCSDLIEGNYCFSS